MPGANPARGGFDSHASPPAWRAVALALALAGVLAACLAGPALAQSADTVAVPQKSDWRVKEGRASSLRSGQRPGTAAWRSLILPGWGQAANHAWIKSAGFLGAYGGLLGWAVSINQKKMDAVGHLNAASTDADIAFWTLEVDRFDNDRNAKYWLMGLTTILAMVDAYVDAHLKDFDRRMDADVGYIPTREGDLAGARLTLRWDRPLDPPPRGAVR